MKKARAVPRVTVYSRHRTGCKWIGKEEKIGCDCPKHLRWYRNGSMHRQTADTCDGEVAERKARDLEASFEAAANGTPAPVKTTGKLLDDAVADFLKTKEQSGVSEKHLGKLKFDLETFARAMLAKGLAMVADVDTASVMGWRNDLAGALVTKAKKVYRLIGFFNFCVDMEWCVRNPARVKSVRFKFDESQKPKALNDGQLALLLAAVQRMNGKLTKDRRRHLRGMLLLMRWSGLAIRDAVCIERARFERKAGYVSLYLRRAKTGHPVYATLKSEVVDEIFSLANPEGRYLFVDAVPEGERELDSLIKAWGGLFSKLGKLAALKDEHGQSLHFTSHSMRHTFVFWCLNSGLPTEDVAALIGDSVPIVVKHYSEWITGRQERLTERMLAALT
jgi:integrase/recombinase XerD